MRIDLLDIVNSKRFDKLSLDLHPHFTLLVGENRARKPRYWMPWLAPNAPLCAADMSVIVFVTDAVPVKRVVARIGACPQAF